MRSKRKIPEFQKLCCGHKPKDKFKGVLSDLTKVTGLHGLDPVVLVLVVGIVMFTLGFAGCVGALRENICLLKFFCGAIVFIFLLELAVAVLAFLFQDWVRDRVKEFFENNIKSYRDDIDLQNLIDSLQKINHCCGAQGPDDWDLNIYFNCSSESKSREKCGVPFSCCIPDPAQKVVNTQCGYDVRKKSKSQWDDQIFIKGCILALEAWLPRNIYIVAGVFIAISLLQVSCFCYATFFNFANADPLRVKVIMEGDSRCLDIFNAFRYENSMAKNRIL
uniref:Tetraspanin 14 n=1 Tax=Apteryx owenii TaxID=8824 RepID=A0A8B9QHH5_APTOW